jgi:hypothetical protein
MRCRRKNISLLWSLRDTLSLLRLIYKHLAALRQGTYAPSYKVGTLADDL